MTNNSRHIQLQPLLKYHSTIILYIFLVKLFLVSAFVFATPSSPLMLAQVSGWYSPISLKILFYATIWFTKNKIPYTDIRSNINMSRILMNMFSYYQLILYESHVSIKGRRSTRREWWGVTKEIARLVNQRKTHPWKQIY